MSAGVPRTVVFDLDGTLVAGDSFGLFLRSLLTRSPVRLVAALVTAPLWAAAMGIGRTRPYAERYLVWLATAGLDDEAFAAATRAFAVGHAGPGGVRVAGVAALRRHLDDGDRVLVATGCAEPLAREVCRVLGLDGAEVVASELDRGRRGLPARSDPVRGQGKIRALERVGVRFPVDDAYSDSWSDLPLLRSARVPHVVDPTARDLARLRAVLGRDVDVVRWAPGEDPVGGGR